MVIPRIEHWSLAVRLIVFSLTATFIGTSVGGWMLRERLHAAVERSFESQLKNHLEYLVAQFEALGVPAARSHRLEQGEFARIFSGWYWSVHQGDTVYQSRSSWDSPLRTHLAHDRYGDGRLWSLDDPTGQPLMGVVQSVTLDGNKAQLYVFGPAQETLQEWQRIDIILLTVQLGLLLALALLSVVSVRIGLQPLRHLQQQLDWVHAGKVHRVGSGFGPDLDPVAMAVDQVLAGNAKVVERAQHQAADLSHALKKPLALLGIEARKAHVSGTWLQEQVQAMSRNIDRHLARFGSGGGNADWVDVEVVLQRINVLMQKIHHQKNLQWDIAATAVLSSGALRWRGVRADLEEMLGNLLDNAGKWGRSQVFITVNKDDRDWVVVCIDDDGTGMSVQQLEQVVHRGQRFDEHVAGHGLGLAIVRDIAEIYGGQLILEQSPLGGVRCRLMLPCY